MEKERPRALPSLTYKQLTRWCGSIYVTVTLDSGGHPFEVYVRFGRAGHGGTAISDGMTKIIPTCSGRVWTRMTP